MDFWPKRWGGRNFDGDKGLGAVHSLGLPYSKQTQGDTTARKVGEFSETVIEEGEPAYFSSGYVQRSGVTRYETYSNETYRGKFQKYGRQLGGHMGGDEFYTMPFQLAGVEESTLQQSVRFYWFDQDVNFQRSRLGKIDATATFEIGGPQFFPGIYPNTVRTPIGGPIGHGGGEPAKVCSIGHSFGISQSYYGEKVSGIRVFTGNRKEAFLDDLPSLPGMERCNLVACAYVTFAPDSFAILVACMFAPAPSGYRGGELFLYKTTNGGNSYNIISLPSIGAHLPGPPDDGNFNSVLNRALQYIQITSKMVVCTPEKWFLSFVTWAPAPPESSEDFVIAGLMFTSNDGGLTWAKGLFPELTEKVDSEHQEVVVENCVYLGQGMMIAKTRSAFIGNDNLWNIIHSEDYGATWACIPKEGLPVDAAPYSFYTGHFKVLRKKTKDRPSILVFTAWDGGSYALYESRDDGFSWVRVATLAKSQVPYGMEPDSANEDLSDNFADLEFLGTEDYPAPLSIETPWRFDRRIPYEEEES